VAPSGELRGKGRCGVFAGKTVWSAPERLKGEVPTTRRSTFTFNFIDYLTKNSFAIKLSTALKRNVQIISRGWRVPAGAENVERLAEDVVVQQAGINTESAHQQDDVSASEEYVPDLAIFTKNNAKSDNKLLKQDGFKPNSGSVEDIRPSEQEIVISLIFTVNG